MRRKFYGGIASLACVLGGVGLAPAAEPAPVGPAAVNSALARARPGETVVLADGTYPDLRLRFRGRGEEGRPITLRPATPGGVKLTGRSNLEVRGAWLVVRDLVFERCTVAPIELRDVRDCRVTGCAILSCNPEDNSRFHWISIGGAESRENRVDHCLTDGKTKDGVVLTVEGERGRMPQNTRVDHNYFRNVSRAVRNGMETIRIGTSDVSQVDAHALVEENRFERCSGDAEIVSSKTCSNVYRRNTFVDCDGALVLRHGHRSVVEGNFFFGAGSRRSAGIRVHGSDHRVLNNYLEGLALFSLALPAGQSKYVPTGHEPALRCVVMHNTVVDPQGPAIVLGGELDRVRDIVPQQAQLLNNLVNGGQGPLLRIEAPTPASWAGNLFWSRSGAPELRGEPGAPPRITGILVADPRLARGADGLWRPGPESPVGDAAPVPFTLERDMDGQPRGAKPEIGADQRGGGPVLYRPLNPADVGPSWMANR